MSKTIMAAVMVVILVVAGVGAYFLMKPGAEEGEAVTLNTQTGTTENSTVLSWSQSTTADFVSYVIYRSMSSGVLGDQIATITNATTTSLTITGLSPNTSYYFMVRVNLTSGIYRDSNQVSVKTLQMGIHDQNISGEIKQDQIWSGTIHVTGDIWIAQNITLTVLPGTTVLVAAHSDDQHSGGHEVPADGYNDNDPTRLFDYPVTHISIYGRIVARGTPDNMITFTSDSPTPGYVDWQDIGLEPGSIMEYCIVEYARNGVDASFAEDNALISHNIVRHTLWGGIGCGSASPTVTYNHIYDCGHEGVDTQPEGGKPYIAYNMIENCAGGIVINPGALPTVEHNTLINNDRGIWIDRAGGIVRYNSISSPQGAPHDWTYENFAYEAWAPHGKYEWIWGIGISDASPMISNNVLFNNPMNIRITGNSSPTITYNTIIDGNTGIQFNNFSGSPKIQMNNIFGNRWNIQLLGPGIYSINAKNNWWGTTNPSAIETSIRDSHDDPSLLGTLNYEPFLTEPVIISAAE